MSELINFHSFFDVINFCNNNKKKDASDKKYTMVDGETSWVGVKTFLYIVIFRNAFEFECPHEAVQ
jgi:hypothetical protein